MGLPKSLIKKYGVTKKAWKIYKSQQHSTNKSAGTAIKTKTTRGVPMAKKRKGFFKKHYSKSAGVSPEGLILPSMIYGAVREKASNMLTPITSKVPLGNVADEVVLGGIAYFVAKKFSSNKMIRDVARAALTVEAARLGEAVINGQVGLGGTSTSGQNY